MRMSLPFCGKCRNLPIKMGQRMLLGSKMATRVAGAIQWNVSTTMIPNFYLPRTLSFKDAIYSEEAVLNASNYVVVLSEPGGGKTELLGSLARRLGVSAVSANVFSHAGADIGTSALVIDAFDELAKIDQVGIHRLLAHASKVNPTHIIISSRSSEWDKAATHAFEEFLGHEPMVVRLCEFDETEQRVIFDNHVPGEDFGAFRAEVTRFDLDALLPNPQFLKLFADAYLESNRKFLDKRSIFSQAVERLAREVNPKVSNRNYTSSIFEKVLYASEIFAKLLLSGAEGIATSESSENRIYPLLRSLTHRGLPAVDVLATRLFKPSDFLDQHNPVHKVVAEYCAADYLTKRIADPLDPLTLSKCLPIIAPNSIVRDELRGLLGWMASLGNKSIEEATIALDPYAVLANGDPSQLESSSKRLLIHRLKETETKDPYFRRGDFWRRFSVAGFFTPDVIAEIKPILADGNDGHLRDLILELLLGSKAVERLEDDLQRLIVAPNESEHTRLLASKCILGISHHDHFSDIRILVFEATKSSLRIASNIIENLHSESLDESILEEFFRSCAGLYSVLQGGRDIVVGANYFIKHLIGTLDLKVVENLLDKLSRDLECECGKQSYECDCRVGISKIIGSMLDHYFEFSVAPFDSNRVWQWVGNLNFREQKSAALSKAVETIRSDVELRRGIISYVFGKLTDRNLIFETRIHRFDFHAHSGLTLYREDHRFLVDLAFERDNPNLWASFVTSHLYYRNKEDQGGDDFRKYLRSQALAKPSFMREWAKINRAAAQSARQHGMPSLRRRINRNQRRRKGVHTENIRYIQENRQLVESGRDWPCLVRFAQLVLMSPEQIEEEFGDEKVVRNALRNCLDFISPDVPTLDRVAELRCASQGVAVEQVLLASCMEIMRQKHNLNEVGIPLLQVVRANINVHYSSVTDEELKALKSEVDRLVFSDGVSAEQFIRRYIEPQLVDSGCRNPDVWLLNEEIFSDLRPALSVEWLERFHDLALGSLDSIFDIAAQYGNRDALLEVIEHRCSNLILDSARFPSDYDFEQKQKFWFLRSFYFLSDISPVQWDNLKSDKDMIHVFYERSGRFGRNDESSWPILSVIKVEAILLAFIGHWPKVDLPNHWGTDSPKEETAYRFIKDLVWSISLYDFDEAIPVLDRLLVDSRFQEFIKDLSSLYSMQLRKRALSNFEPPTPQEIVCLLDNEEVVSVEGLRKLVIQELHDYQKAIDGGEFNSADVFYEKEARLDEVRCTLIIAERLNLRLQPQGISVTPEHQLKSGNRSDFTVTKMIGGVRKLLVTEVKGQWHRELYTAARAQLSERYSIHPDAEQQGIFLVIWFGEHEKVAGRKRHGIVTAKQMKDAIEAALPSQLAGLIDVFVLNVAKPRKQVR